jgi:quercetin dioxygenase-like cupin family protein
LTQPQQLARVLESPTLTDKVLTAERMMREMPQVDLKTTHYYADGMYGREVFRPAGTVIVGKVHKKEHFYIVLRGRVRVVMDDDMKEYAAPAVIVSKPGTKRAVYAIEDSTCMTVHRSKKRNLDKLERELVEEDKLSLFDSGNNIKPLRLNVSCDGKVG